MLTCIPWQDLFRTAETMAGLEAKDVKNQEELLEEKITQEEFLSRRELIFKRIELNRRHKGMLQSKVSSVSVCCCSPRVWP